MECNRRTRFCSCVIYNQENIMSLSIGVVEKEYNQLLKERTQLQESVQRLEEDLAKSRASLNAVHGAVQILEKLMRKEESDLTLRNAEKHIKPEVKQEEKK